MTVVRHKPMSTINSIEVDNTIKDFKRNLYICLEDLPSKSSKFITSVCTFHLKGIFCSLFF